MGHPITHKSQNPNLKTVPKKCAYGWFLLKSIVSAGKNFPESHPSHHLIPFHHFILIPERFPSNDFFVKCQKDVEEQLNVVCHVLDRLNKGSSMSIDLFGYYLKASPLPIHDLLFSTHTGFQSHAFRDCLLSCILLTNPSDS